MRKVKYASRKRKSGRAIDIFDSSQVGSQTPLRAKRRTMDLRSILTQPEKKPNTNLYDTLKKRSSINDLMNAETQAEPQQQGEMKSPMTTTRTVGLTETPAKNAGTKTRHSISSLTNDTDVDVDGKETPSIARRQSYTSGSNSPIVPKKTISRAPNLQDVMNEDKVNVAQDHKRKTEPKDSNKIETPKKTVTDELTALDNIEKKIESQEVRKTKDGRIKPRHYAQPPIWAQKWIPVSKRSERGNDQHGSKSVGPVRHSDGPDMKRSITGVKPYNDTTRRISNWIYAQISATPKEHREFLELEVKFGRLWHKQTDRRVLIPVTNECIVDDSYILDCSYRSGMDKEHYDRAKRFITGLSKIHADAFRTMKTDQVDSVYREASRGQLPKFYRLTTDRATGRLTANIEKKKLGNLHIHCPDLIFDYRLTMSIELPSTENPDRFENQTAETKRFKKRTSVIHPVTATRIDMTEVSTKGKRSSDNTESLEMELEVDMPRLLQAFDNLENDAYTFEDLGETLMDNARILNRELIKPGPQ